MSRAFTFLLVLAALSATFASASVTVQLSQGYYNIGDTIAAAASAVPADDISGFMRFTALCGGFSLPYYLTPVELQQGFRTQINAPPLNAIQAMKGTCRIETSILDEQGQALETGSSGQFQVSDGLSIILLNENLTALPGATLSIEGIVRGAGDKMVDAGIGLSFDDESYQAATANGRFSVQVGVSPVAKSGSHSLHVTATAQQNRGELSEEVEIVAVPSHLALAADAPQKNPGESISYTADLTDQAGDPLQETIEAALKGPDGLYLFRNGVPSAAAQGYVLGPHLPPGNYILEVRYLNLMAIQTVKMNAVRDIRVSQQGQSIIFTNAGNIPIEEEITLLAQGKRTYAIRKTLDLKPGESSSIDLGKELPSGTYDIVLPEGMRFSGADDAQGTATVAKGVQVQDARSAMKKFSEGVGATTAAVVGADGILTRNPWYAPLLLITIIVLLTAYYSRNLWVPLVSRRRKASRKDQDGKKRMDIVWEKES